MGQPNSSEKNKLFGSKNWSILHEIGLKRFFKLFSESIPKDFFKHNVNSDLESEKLLQGSYLSLSTVTSFGVVMISNA